MLVRALGSWCSLCCIGVCCIGVGVMLVLVMLGVGVHEHRCISKKKLIFDCGGGAGHHSISLDWVALALGVASVGVCWGLCWHMVLIQSPSGLRMTNEEGHGSRHMIALADTCAMHRSSGRQSPLNFGQALTHCSLTNARDNA